MQRAAGRSPAAQFCILDRNLVPRVVDRCEKRVYTYIERIFWFTTDLRGDTVMPEYFGKNYDKIQPTNCHAAGRQYEIDHGTLPVIEAGEKKHFDITLEILEGEDEYRRFIAK